MLDDLKLRGLIHQMTDEEGLRRALSTSRVTGYIGFDPTASSLHVGSLLQITMLVRLARAGHRPIAVIGGATGLIGDPSGKTAERTLLTRERLDENLAGIRAQLSRYLDFDGGQALLVDNAEWFAGMNVLDFLRDVGKHFSVNAMIARDTVRDRLEKREQGISYTEFSYMLLQAYDFLALHDRHGCALQIGGSDQWGNVVSGVELIRRMRGVEAFGLTTPLVTRADGVKFGKTETGTVWLDPARTSPYELYQFFVNAADADVESLLKLLTFEPLEAIAAALEAHAREPGRRVPQRLLAESVTRFVHGDEGLARAMKTTEVLFGGGDWSELSTEELDAGLRSAPTHTVARGALGTREASLVELCAGEGRLFKSKTEARTFIQKGGLSLNNSVCTDPTRALALDDLVGGVFAVLRKGKRSYYVVRVE
ncbi:MAG: tyrosine--tRNA ligase [Polyangiales bacterium]